MQVCRRALAPVGGFPLRRASRHLSCSRRLWPTLGLQACKRQATIIHNHGVGRRRRFGVFCPVLPACSWHSEDVAAKTGALPGPPSTVSSLNHADAFVRSRHILTLRLLRHARNTHTKASILTAVYALEELYRASSCLKALCRSASN